MRTAASPGVRHALWVHVQPDRSALSSRLARTRGGGVCVGGWLLHLWRLHKDTWVPDSAHELCMTCDKDEDMKRRQEGIQDVVNARDVVRFSVPSHGSESYDNLDNWESA